MNNKRNEQQHLNIGSTAMQHYWTGDTYNNIITIYDQANIGGGGGGGGVGL